MMVFLFLTIGAFSAAVNHDLAFGLLFLMLAGMYGTNVIDQWEWELRQKKAHRLGGKR